MKGEDSEKLDVAGARERSTAMKSPVPTARNLWPHRFQPGQSGNPSGRPRGGRNKLSEDFVQALYDDFKQHGRGAIVAVREKDTSTYVKVIAQLLPREVPPTRPLEGMSDDELIEAIALLQSQIRGALIDGENADLSDTLLLHEQANAAPKQDSRCP